MLIHPKDVQNIKLLSSEKAINRSEEVAEVQDEDSHYCQAEWEKESSDKCKKLINTVERKEREHTTSQEQSDRHSSYSDNSEKSINRENWIEATNREVGKSVMGIGNINSESIHLCNKSEKLLNPSTDSTGLTVLPCVGEGSFPGQIKEITFTTLVRDSDNCNKSIICFQHTGAPLGVTWDVETERYILLGNWIGESDGSEKSINCACCERLKQLV